LNGFSWAETLIKNLTNLNVHFRFLRNANGITGIQNSKIQRYVCLVENLQHEPDVLGGDEEAFSVTGMKRLLMRASWVGGLMAAVCLCPGAARGDLVVAWSRTVQLYDERTGALLAQTTNSYRGETLTSITVGPDGNIYGPENFGGPGSVIRFDARTANVVDEFVPYDDYNAALWIPGTARFGPDGDLYVGSSVGRNGKPLIYRFDGKTGGAKGNLLLDASLSGGLFAFGPDGNLYLYSTTGDGVLIVRVNPQTGELIDTFATLPEVSSVYGWRSITFWAGRESLSAEEKRLSSGWDVWRIDGAFYRYGRSRDDE
jgi:hypothetical protein